MVKIKKRNPDPFTFRGNSTGILLVHGFTGTPSELRPMGEYLRNKQYTVHAPLLKGHGTTPQDMANTSWKDWWNSALKGYLELERMGCKQIFIAGLSMGGVLSMNLAYEQKVNGIISMCTPVYVRDPRIHLCRFLKYIKPFQPNRGEKEPHIEAYLYSYDQTPLHCVAELQKLIVHVRKKIPHISTPVLIAQAEQDETVLPRSAQYIYEKIGSKRKEIQWYPKSSHIITLDREREKLFLDIHLFIQRILSKNQ